MRVAFRAFPWGPATAAVEEDAGASVAGSNAVPHQMQTVAATLTVRWQLGQERPNEAGGGEGGGAGAQPRAAALAPSPAPGTRSVFPHCGQITSRPAYSCGTLDVYLHDGQVTTIPTVRIISRGFPAATIWSRMIFVDRLRYNERFPWVNYGLIAANILIFLFVNVPLMASGSEDAFIKLHGDWGFVGARFSAITLVTCMFLHAGFEHIVVNLLLLWIFGANVERRLGHAIYLAAYLVTGICGTLLFHAFNPTPELPLVGASGALSGVMGLYAVFYPRWKLDFIFGLPLTGWSGVFKVPAFIVMGLFFLKDVVEYFATLGDTEVAHLGHIGGFLSGAAIGLAVRRAFRERSFILSAEPPSENELQAEIRAWSHSSVLRPRAAYAVAASSRVAVIARSHSPFRAEDLPQDGFPDAVVEQLRNEVRQTRGLYFRSLEFGTATQLVTLLQRTYSFRYLIQPASRFTELPPSEAPVDIDFDERGARLRLSDSPLLLLPYRELLMALAGCVAPPGGRPMDVIALFARRPWRRYVLNPRILTFDMLRARGQAGAGLREIAARVLKYRGIRIVNKGLLNLEAGEPMGRLSFEGMSDFDNYALWLMNMVGLAQ